MVFTGFVSLVVRAIGQLQTAKDMNDLDQEEMGDDTMGSDIDDHASETDSKKDGASSRSGDGKSQGNSSKPRR